MSGPAAYIRHLQHSLSAAALAPENSQEPFVMKERKQQNGFALGAYRR